MNPKRRLQQRLQQHLQRRLQRLRHSSLLQHLSSHLSKHLSSHLSMHLSSRSLPRFPEQHISVPPFVVFYRKISAIIVYVVVHNCVLWAILGRCMESQRRGENPLGNEMPRTPRTERPHRSSQTVEKALVGWGAVPQFAMVVLLLKSQYSLAHWASASLRPPLAALRLRPPEASNRRKRLARWRRSSGGRRLRTLGLRAFGSPCGARVSSQKAPTERYEQVPSANSKKCKMHFFDTLRRPHRSSQSPAGMSFSMLSRARSLSITGYASEIGLSMVPSTISCFFLGRITITSGLECPKRERKSHECGFLLCKPHLAEQNLRCRETGEKTRNRRELSKNRVRAGTQNTNNRMVLIPALFVVQNA